MIFNRILSLDQLNELQTLVIIMVAEKYAFLQTATRRLLNEWDAFKKVIRRRNIRRRITIPLTLSNFKLLSGIPRTLHSLHTRLSFFLFEIKRRPPRFTLLPHRPFSA